VLQDTVEVKGAKQRIAGGDGRTRQSPAGRIGCLEDVRDEYGCGRYEPALEEKGKIIGAQTGRRQVDQRGDADRQNADDTEDGGESANRPYHMGWIDDPVVGVAFRSPAVYFTCRMAC
jgi:hypothetical protein